MQRNAADDFFYDAVNELYPKSPFRQLNYEIIKKKAENVCFLPSINKLAA